MVIDDLPATYSGHRRGVVLYIAQQVVAAGAKRVVWEYRFHPPRRWRFDMALPVEKIALEIEGGLWVGGRHVRPRAFERDCEKYATAVLDGWRIFRASWDQVEHLVALDWLKAAITQEGEPRCLKTT